MPKPQPSFTAEFKKEAVQLAYTSGKPKAQTAHSRAQNKRRGALSRPTNSPTVEIANLYRQEEKESL